MAKKKKPAAAERPDPAEQLAKMERPHIKWRVIAQIALGFAVVWIVAFMAVPYVSYWGVGVAAVLTLVALGFGVYVWRLTRKSAAIVDILKTATDDEGRAAALAKLEAQGAKSKNRDALNALARAQLVAQKDPGEALRILESIDLDKAPALVQDDVRANLGMVYLTQGRAREAREIADAIKLDRQPQASSRAMYAAVIAESHARTGDAERGLELMGTYDPSDPDYADMRAMLLRARAYVYFAAKKRIGRAHV